MTRSTKGLCHRKPRTWFQYGVGFLFLGAWTSWSLFQSTHFIPLWSDEETIHDPPNAIPKYGEPVSDNSFTRATVSKKEQPQVFSHHHQHHRTNQRFEGSSMEGLKTLGLFKTKALLEKHGRLPAKASLLNTMSTNSTTKPYRRTIRPYQRKYRKVLYFVHIHKSAGTLFCRLSYKNRVNANHRDNCNVQDDQYCCGGQDTLDAQISFANRTYWDLVATERELYDSLAPDYYDYIVTLRDSKQRYYSHWNHLRRMIPVGPGVQTGGFGNSAWIFGNNTIMNYRIKERSLRIGEDPLGNFSHWYKGQPDNWNARILCGRKCRVCSKFQITPQLFQYTLQRANQFAHFLFVEDMEASYNRIAEAYQWANYSVVATNFLIDHRSKKRTDANAAAVRQRLDNEEWDPFMSALDDALYEFALRKYRHVVADKELWRPFQNQGLVDRYFVEGPSRGCENACCGNCTSY